ncbi:hypothetical protein AYI68_g4314 [Smittium mucronatum]|uniref:Uncharacterized protein n=1 Tax=Smittium mucronatum TaxID=133383 RepID=A0A1R0GXG2_9FUNG|nr:hypothetical protein AYI68_g4314 [Smittium mucronatum]
MMKNWINISVFIILSAAYLATCNTKGSYNHKELVSDRHRDSYLYNTDIKRPVYYRHSIRPHPSNEIPYIPHYIVKKSENAEKTISPKELKSDGKNQEPDFKKTKPDGMKQWGNNWGNNWGNGYGNNWGNWGNWDACGGRRYRCDGTGSSTYSICSNGAWASQPCGRGTGCLDIGNGGVTCGVYTNGWNAGWNNGWNNGWGGWRK